MFGRSTGIYRGQVFLRCQVVRHGNEISLQYGNDTKQNFFRVRAYCNDETVRPSDKRKKAFEKNNDRGISLYSLAISFQKKHFKTGEKANESKRIN
jgi:hypothetical protein